MSKTLESLASEVLALPLASRLRLAADLLDQSRADVALPIVRRVADELGLEFLMAAHGVTAPRAPR